MSIGMGVTRHEYSRCPDVIVDLYRDGKVAEKVYGTSGAIRNASAAFDRMLDPDNGFRTLPTETAFGRQLRLLSLPEDDADSMLILLKLIHYQTSAISKVVSYKLLVELAIICDKYDCGAILHPWTDIWISNLINTEDHDPLKPGFEGWLLIGHVFPSADGIAAVVGELSIQLAKECYGWGSDHSQFCRYPYSDCEVTLDSSKSITVDLRFNPYPIMQHIFQESERGKSSILETIRGFFTTLGLVGDIDSNQSTTNSSLCSDQICVELATGSVVRSIRQLGLSVRQISDPEGFGDLPLWLFCKRLKIIAKNCRTIVPWSRSSHPVIVQSNPYVDYTAMTMSQKNANLGHIQAVLLSDPTKKSSASPDGIRSLTGPERCGIAEKAREISDYSDTVQSSMERWAYTGSDKSEGPS
ncbi:hypothetical protein TWF730_002994 [Orbilia blumenaviensis]|uniref:Uncharacterized protein n=1 Tax=Orbilia blumenaviensis TaxID=1796055 RepID=A0AAV9U8J2_9PEZI